MRFTEDEMNRMLADLDPAANVPAPQMGSPRYQLIKEKIMTAQADAVEQVDTTQPRDLGSAAVSRRWHPVRYTAIAATAAVAVFGVVVLAPWQTESAEATVAAAAAATGQVESLRGEATRENFNSFSDSAVVEYSDGNVRVLSSQNGGTETVVIGDRMYENRNGEISKSRIEPEQTLAPYAASAASVITASLASSDVEEEGSESMGGVEAVRYVITLDAASRRALGSLTPSELAWFELEYPDEVSQVDVWVADDLIRKVVVHAGNGTATTEFYDFGAPIQIEVPDWSK